MKNLISKITPYITLNQENIYKKYGFKITNTSLEILSPSKWLRLTVDWNSELESFKFKYASDYGFGSCGNSVFFCLEFKEVKYRFRSKKVSWTTCVNLDIGIEIPDDKMFDFPYETKYWDNTKYGMVAYFSPRGWEEKQSSKVLSCFKNL